jgi:ATP-dependent DNA helicase RecQ
MMPTNDSQFLSITGVGHIKLDKYGEEFLSEIKQYVDTL